MVDTYLRPRPEFATLLASDASAGGDDLSIHQQKRALRQGKVLILQQKRQSQLLEKAQALQEYRSKITSFAAEPGKSVGGHGNRSRYWTEPGYMPRPSAVRPVKSAGMQRHVTWDSFQLARPKTADSADSRPELLAPKQGSVRVSWCVLIPRVLFSSVLCRLGGGERPLPPQCCSHSIPHPPTDTERRLSGEAGGHQSCSLQGEHTHTHTLNAHAVH